MKKVYLIQKFRGSGNLGQDCFNLGTFFLASSLTIGALFYLVALLISFFKINSNILKERWSIYLLVIGGLIISNQIRFSFFYSDENLNSFDIANSFYSIFNWLPFFFNIYILSNIS